MYSSSLKDKLKTWWGHIEAAFEHQPYLAYPLLVLLFTAIAIPVAAWYYHVNQTIITSSPTTSYANNSGKKSKSNGSPSSSSGSSTSSSGGSSSSSGSSSGGTSKPNYPRNPNTWGYIGCSNTHDTAWGYHDTAKVSSQNLFWPFKGYGIEGATVAHWDNPNDPHWALFDSMKQTYNNGADPPVIWVQFCADLDQSEPNYAPVTYDDVVTMINNIRKHAPTSALYISPLQSYDPLDICPKMGTNGEEIARVAGYASQAVDAGLALAGPGTKGITNLGPLTVDNTALDHCHPSGGPHKPNLATSVQGVDLLGQQLADFFDKL